MFGRSEFELVLWETGYKKPLSSLGLTDREVLMSTLQVHVLSRVKAELDQFRDGLGMFGVLKAMETHSALMAPLFTHTWEMLTSGLWLCTASFFTFSRSFFELSGSC